MQRSSKKKQASTTTDSMEEALLKEGDEWEHGYRGGVETTTTATAAEEQAADAGLELHMISIRLPVHMIDALKRLAADSGLKYQPYLRKVLMDHLRGPSIEARVAELEKKHLGKKR